MWLKKRQKKAAIELSMSTIIIIIIGVVLLTLGLTFVTGTFEKLKVMVNTALVHGKDQITNYGATNQPLTISPETMNLKKGESDFVKVILKNMGDKTTTASVTASTKSTEDDLTCLLLDTESAKSDAYTIKSGENTEIKVRVNSMKTGTLGDKSCKFVAFGLGDNVQQILTIKVEA